MVRNAWKAIAKASAEFVAPRHCLITQAPLSAPQLYYAEGVLDTLPKAPEPDILYHQTLGVKDYFDKIVASNIFAIWQYSPELEIHKLIYALKYQGYRNLGVILGELLGNALLNTKIKFDVIVPVPIHAARRRERGFNQAEAIAEGVQRVKAARIVPQALRRTRLTLSQTKITLAERILNCRETLVAGPDISEVNGKNVLLVDDVITSGATSYFCSEALIAAHATSVSVAAVCSATLTIEQRTEYEGH